MCTNENGVKQLCYENFNQKFLVNGGVQLFFGNVFLPVEGEKLPMIKNKLRKILVDFGLVQTCIEIDQKLDFIKVWYKDPKATELRGNLLQRFNQSKESQAIEISISLEDSLVTPPDKEGKIKTYTGLTKLIYQESIQSTESRTLIDDNPYNEMKEIIKQGNLSPCVPLESIFRGELG